MVFGPGGQGWGMILDLDQPRVEIRRAEVPLSSDEEAFDSAVCVRQANLNLT